MTITKDRDWLAELQRTVEREAKKRPPPKPIPADGCEMQHPAAAIRERLIREDKRERMVRRLLEAVFYIGGVAAGLTASAIFILYLVKPSILNL